MTELPGTGGAPAPGAAPDDDVPVAFQDPGYRAAVVDLLEQLGVLK